MTLSLFYRLGLIHSPFCLRFSFVILINIFSMSGLLFLTFYRNCIFMSYYFVVLLKQTTEVKTQPIAHVTQFHNSCLSMSHSVSHNRGLR